MRTLICTTFNKISKSESNLFFCLGIYFSGYRIESKRYEHLKISEIFQSVQVQENFRCFQKHLKKKWPSICVPDYHIVILGVVVVDWHSSQQLFLIYEVKCHKLFFFIRNTAPFYKYGLLNGLLKIVCG